MSGERSDERAIIFPGEIHNKTEREQEVPKSQKHALILTWIPHKKQR